MSVKTQGSGLYLDSTYAQPSFCHNIASQDE